ncbi:MAG: hypothetical protein FNT15_00410 [Sulfurovum sp.]|nr:MAG: hypothetical protein FNT15_00410 [Sulfurovum sp.]
MADIKHDKLNSEWHTLFKKETLEEKKAVDKEKNIYEIVPKYTTYTVYIDSFMERKRGLHEVFQELRGSTTKDILEFRISSGGGFVLEGKQFYNIIIEKFHKRTVGYLDYGYSMGALLFSMLDKRVIYEYSDFMYHNYAGGAHGKGDNILSRVLHTDKILKKFFHDITVKKGFLSEEEFELMIVGKDFWMDTVEMCQRGIATHIVRRGEEITANDYLIEIGVLEKPVEVNEVESDEVTSETIEDEITNNDSKVLEEKETTQEQEEVKEQESKSDEE